MPCALIGRLAVDERAQGRRLGEKLLIEALRRIVDAAEILGCIGVIVGPRTRLGRGRVRLRALRLGTSCANAACSLTRASSPSS